MRYIARVSVRTRGLLIVLSAALALLAMPGVALAERTVGLSSGTFEFAVAAGEGGRGQVSVYNNGDEPLKVLVYVANQFVGDGGAVTYEVPDRDDSGHLQSPASWVSYSVGKQLKATRNTPYLELVPGEQVPVDFVFEVPTGAPPGDHNVLLFFEMVSDDELESGSSPVTGRIGARLRIRVAGEVIEDLTVDPFYARSFAIGGSLPYTFDIVNGGNTDRSVAATLRLTRGGREVAASAVETAVPVYAGATVERTGNLLIPGFRLGRYTLAIDLADPRDGVASGSSAITSVERIVWLFPLWLAIVLVITIGLTAMAVTWRDKANAGTHRAGRHRARRARRRNTSDN